MTILELKERLTNIFTGVEPGTGLQYINIGVNGDIYPFDNPSKYVEKNDIIESINRLVDALASDLEKGDNEVYVDGDYFTVHVD